MKASNLSNGFAIASYGNRQMIFNGLPGIPQALTYILDPLPYNSPVETTCPFRLSQLRKVLSILFKGLIIQDIYFSKPSFGTVFIYLKEFTDLLDFLIS